MERKFSKEQLITLSERILNAFPDSKSNTVFYAKAEKNYIAAALDMACTAVDDDNKLFGEFISKVNEIIDKKSFGMRMLELSDEAKYFLENLFKDIPDNSLRSIFIGVRVYADRLDNKSFLDVLDLDNV